MTSIALVAAMGLVARPLDGSDSTRPQSAADRPSAERRLQGHATAVNRLAFSPDGRLLATGVVGGPILAAGEPIRVWRVATGELLGQTSALSGLLTFSMDATGKSLVTVTREKPKLLYETVVSSWNVAEIRARTGDQPILLGRGDPPLLRYPESISAAFLSADGRFFATPLHTPPEELTKLLVWRLDAGGAEPAFRVPVANVRSVAFHPNEDSLRILALGMRVVTVSTLTGETLRDQVIEQKFSTAWSLPPNPDLMVTLADPCCHTPSQLRGASVWDLNTGERITRIPEINYSYYVRAELAPDGKLLATVSPARAASGNKEAIVRLWTLPFAVDPVEFRAEPMPFHSMAFSPEGRFLAAGVGDGTVRLWDVHAISDRQEVR